MKMPRVPKYVIDPLEPFDAFVFAWSGPWRA
jgi:hypothetical protein